MLRQEEITLNQWIEKLQSQGKYAFSIHMLAEMLPAYSDIAARSALSRLTVKRKIISIYRGYYLIIPPQYTTKGVLPPELFLDGLMRNLQRPYYLALLNAASFFEASHQQPQEFFVITNFPVLRTTLKKGTKINYLSKKNIPETLLKTIKTETGYLKISNPALTACDLIQFEKRIGGLSRASTVLSELVDSIKPEMFNNQLFEYVPVTTFQRLGYILEKVLENKRLSDRLFNELKKRKINLFRTPLKTTVAVTGHSVNQRWKVIVNAEIELDD
jgi:predicted transcriptional regulator of viral defense system